MEVSNIGPPAFDSNMEADMDIDMDIDLTLDPTTTAFEDEAMRVVSSYLRATETMRQS